jgi:hypothetical protein
MPKPHLLIIVFNSLQYDARVKRQIKALRDVYEVDVACYSSEPIDGVKLIILKKPKLGLANKALIMINVLLRNTMGVHRLLFPYDSFRSQVKGGYDLILANDIESLPMAFSFDRPVPVILDAHEYSPRHFEDSFQWRLIFRPVIIDICNNYLHRVKRMLTVCDSLAEEYQREFDIRPEVITNAPSYEELSPSPIDPESIRIVYHGGINRSRKIENMIQMMDYLPDNYRLDLILVEPGSMAKATRLYVEGIRSMADAHPQVRLLPPFRPEEVVAATNSYDIGVFILEPVNFNYTYALPNKLFEFIQARLAVFIGPSIEMKQLVEKYNCGKVAKDFHPESLATEILSTSAEELMRFKMNSGIAAENENAEVNKKKLLQILEA